MKKILLFVGSFLLFFLCAEILFRTFYIEIFSYAWQMEGKYELDRDLIYKNKPLYDATFVTDTFVEKAKINIQAFRNDFIEKRSENEFRIATVGDSFTYGYGISRDDLTYPYVLQQKLTREFPYQKIQVFNMGVGGYSPDQEYRFILRRVLSYDPDIVIWALNPNDIYNLISKENPALYDYDGNGLIPIQVEQTWLYYRGVAAKYLHPTLKKSRILAFLTQKLMLLPHLNFSQSMPFEKRIIWAQQKLIAEIESANQFLKIRNRKLLIVIIPTKNSYDTGIYKNSDEFVDSALNATKIKVIQDKIPVFDLGEEILSGMRQTKQPVQSLFFEREYHLNEKGTEVVASLIQNHLTLFIK